MHSSPQRICLIGAECTGKTVLARQLAASLGGLVVPEVLRDWCAAHGRTPQQHEQAALLQAQVDQENQAVALIDTAHDAPVFCDTAPLLTAVYSLQYFADASLLAAAHAHHQRYALTLWLQPDLPWMADGLQRDGRATQLAVHQLLAQHLAPHQPVVPIFGQGPLRLQAALAACASISCGRQQTTG